MTKNLVESKKIIIDNPGGGGFVKFIKVLLMLFVLFSVLSIIIAAWGISSLKKDLPSFHSIEEYKPVLGTSLYSHNGIKIADFAIEKREIVAFDKIPEKLVQAFVAAEDKNFFSHIGVDPYYIMRAIITNLKAGRIKEGASTITMQLARTLFLSREKKFIRKLNEVILAVFELEMNLSKEEILWLYLNQIYLGHGAYGVQQTAKSYFGKNVWELEIDEMAIIAGQPKAPGRDSPFVNMRKAKIRKAYVLRRMLEEDFITQKEHDEALAKPIILNETPDPFLLTAPHYSEHVRKYIYDTYGEDTLYNGGLYVQTAVQLPAQIFAQDALYYGLRSLDHRQGYRGAIVNLDREYWAEFIGKQSEFYKNEQLKRDEIYIGLVTKVDNKRDRTAVSVGIWEAYIPYRSMKWARKPNEKRHWSEDMLRKPSMALKAGDVIYVRPSHLAGLKNNYDFRSTEPIDTDNMIWILEQKPKAQAGIVSKDPHSGYQTAMVGGYDFESSEFNRAIQACRQPGSAFKPIVYSAAIKKGWNVSTVILDAPIVAGENKQKWKPENYGSDFKGEVSLRYALQQSLNIPAIKTLDYVGVARIKDLAIKMGVKSNIQEDRSISLGSACTTVEDMTNVFSHFVNKGVKPDTVYVKAIIDQNFNFVEDNRIYYDITLDPAEKLARMEAEILREREQVLPENEAFIMGWLLRQVVNGGTGSGARSLGRPCGGKTGTTNDSYDAWFMGFTPDIVTGVWIGHDDNSRTLGKRETGGHAALPIWLDYMKHKLQNSPVLEFEEADKIDWIRVDKKTGRKAIKGAAQTIKAPFKPGTKPAETMVMEGEQNPDEFFKMTEIY